MLESNLSADLGAGNRGRDARLRVSLRSCQRLGTGINAKNSSCSLAHLPKPHYPLETLKTL